MGPISPEQLDKIKAENPSLELVLLGTDVQIVCKMPNREIYRRFRQNLRSDGPKRDSAKEQFIADCCVYPTAAEWFGILEKRPALADRFCEALVKAAGGDDSSEEKKVLA